MQLTLPRFLKHSLLYLLFPLFFLRATAQLTDGPIQLQAKVRDVQVTLASNSDFTLSVGSLPLGPYTDDEYTFKVYARDDIDLDATGYTGGLCHQQNFVTVPNTSVDYNDLIFNYTYLTATVPQFLDINIDAYEEDLPIDFSPAAVAALNVCDNPPRAQCQFDGLTCCVTIPIFGCVFSEADDIRCNPAVFFDNLNYRMGPPCQWYSHGFLVGSCGATNYYQPRIETFWRYTKGTACANAIPIGPGAGLNPGFTAFSHFNSNECYTNNWPASAGNDVFYSITVTSPVGVNISLCGGATWDTYLYLLNSSCTTIASNDNGCGSNSVINQALCTPGTYYIVVDGASAAAMGTFTLLVSENATLVPRADAGSDKTSCAGVAEQIGTLPGYTGGVGPYTFDWNPGLLTTDSAITNPFAFPLTTTSFILTVTDLASGCTDTDTMTLLINSPPSVDLGNDTTLCPTYPLTLDAGAGYVAYFWSTGATAVDTQVIDDPGLYFVNVIDIFGCLGNDTINVYNYVSPALDLGPDTNICAGANINLNAPLAMTAYNWSTGATGVSTINVTTAGTYHVTITDGNGCQSADTIVVGINALPVVTVNDQSVCPGATATIDAGAGFLGYVWSTGAVGQYILTSTPGPYDVTVTDANGCQNTDNMVLSNYAPPVVALPADDSICASSFMILDAGAGFSGYAWSTGATTQTISVMYPGAYSVTVTDVNGCTGSDDFNLTWRSALNPSLGADQTLCSGDNLTLDAGAGYTLYGWSTGASTQTINVTFPGTYIVMVADAGGCIGYDTIVVTPLASPTVDLGNDLTFCAGGGVTADAGPGFSSYAWSTGGSSQTENITVAGSVTVTVTNAAGCSATDVVNVTMSPNPTVDLGPATMSICDSGNVMLDAGTGMETYLWSDGSVNQYLFVSAGGVYSVTVTNEFGCTATDNITINTTASTSVDLLGPDQTICAGTDLLLDAGIYATYLWSDGSVNQYLMVDTSGIYTVEAIDDGGCRYYDTIFITLNSPPALNLGADNQLCPGETVTLDAGSGYTSYLWSNGATTQSITVDTKGQYAVTVTYLTCTLMDDVTVGDDCGGRLFVPNVFSPNGDGINDFFQITGNGIETANFTIHDRWGKLIFTGPDMATTWKGNFNSNDAPAGVYYYHVDYKFTDESIRREVSGSVTLLR